MGTLELVNQTAFNPLQVSAEQVSRLGLDDYDCQIELWMVAVAVSIAVIVTARQHFR